MMMYKKMFNKLSMVAAMLFMFAACDLFDSSVLDKDPLDQPSDAAVWQDAAMTQAFVNDIYGDLAHDMREVMLAIHTDEAVFTHIGSAEVPQGIVTPSNLYGTTWGWAWWTGPPGGGNLVWSAIWGAIRKTNLFFANFDPDLFEDQALADQLIGEVHFLRAMKYHDLLKLWGGVPIVTEPFGLDSDMELPRESFEDVVEFIVADAEEAAGRLDWHPRESGRASRGAALALINKTLTYAASDLYHNLDWAGGYAHPELIGYPAGNQQQLWTRARDVALEIINNGPYSLYNVDPDPTRNYQDIWLQHGGDEAIMSMYVLEEHDDWVNFGLWSGPNGYFLWGGSTPSQQIVDAFETIDGEYFDWSNPAHAAEPFENRDPRLKASIMHDGFSWRERPEGPRSIEPLGQYEAFQTITCVGSDDCPSSRSGLDTRRSAVEDWNGSRSGYVINKFIDPEVEHWNSEQEVPWHYFRYAEVLLNYAEAELELGNEGPARDAINQIRQRAGMPEITDSGDDLVERYRNERRVELAFEMHRYFDVRRWMIAPEIEDQDAYGIYMHAEYQFDAGAPHNGRYNYEYVLPADIPSEAQVTDGNPNIALRPVWARSWNPATYFLPIELTELNRNEALVQNPLY